MIESTVFLTADDQPISLGQALRYLESSGRLESVIWEIIGQYVIDQEVRAIEELDIGVDLIDQVVMDFRLERQLTDYQSFQEWLTGQGIDYTTFRKQITSNLKLETLKTQVTEPNLQEYFIKRRLVWGFTRAFWRI